MQWLWQQGEKQGHKPSCRDILARLHTFVDRELAPEEIREIKDHLQACPPCHEHFTFEEDMKRLVHSCICRDAAPPGLRERIVRACTSHDATQTGAPQQPDSPAPERSEV